MPAADAISDNAALCDALAHYVLSGLLASGASTWLLSFLNFLGYKAMIAMMGSINNRIVDYILSGRLCKQATSDVKFELTMKPECALLSNYIAALHMCTVTTNEKLCRHCSKTKLK